MWYDKEPPIIANLGRTNHDGHYDGRQNNGKSCRDGINYSTFYSMSLTILLLLLINSFQLLSQTLINDPWTKS